MRAAVRYQGCLCGAGERCDCPDHGPRWYHPMSGDHACTVADCVFDRPEVDDERRAALIALKWRADRERQPDFDRVVWKHRHMFGVTVLDPNALRVTWSGT